MDLSLPPEIERNLSKEDAALHLAIGLYVDNRVTLGQGAAIAGISSSQFLSELGKLRIPIHYDAEDALSDVETAAKFERR
jgi:predicted HTH domain antitoxin